MHGSDRPTDINLWMRWVEAGLTDLEGRIRSVGAAAGGAGGGTIVSVNGDTGPAVSLDAGDVGADPAGTAAGAMTTHLAAPDPHPQYLTPAEGDAAYDANGAAAAAQAASQPHDTDLDTWATKTAPSGAVVGTTDAQTLTNKTLTAPAISSPTGLVVADVAGAVPSTRQVIAGTGLTGGGTLAADRTLAADFGTGAGKVTQGNDSRLGDARTPTAHAASHATGGGDPITPASIDAVPKTRALTAGYGLTGLGDLTADRTPAVALTTVAATLGADVACALSSTTTVLSITLAAGTWLVNAGALLTGAAAATSDLVLVTGTATLTMAGQQTAGGRSAAANQPQSLAIAGCLVTVTVAGTLLLRVVTAATATVAKALSNQAGSAGATGITAVRIA